MWQWSQVDELLIAVNGQVYWSQPIQSVGGGYPMPVLASPTDKQIALNALDRLPASATLEQMSEELALLATIRRAEAAADCGRVVPHDEVERRSSLWTSK